MSKKCERCERCPMSDKEYCQCEYCTYDKPGSPPTTDKDGIGKASKTNNLFIKAGIQNKITGLLREISTASNDELRQILFAVLKEQRKRNSNSRKQVASKRTSKRFENKKTKGDKPCKQKRN